MKQSQAEKSVCVWVGGGGTGGREDALHSRVEGLPAHRKQEKRLPTAESIEDRRTPLGNKAWESKKKLPGKSWEQWTVLSAQHCATSLQNDCSSSLSESDCFFTRINLQSSEVPIPFTSPGISHPTLRWALTKILNVYMRKGQKESEQLYCSRTKSGYHLLTSHTLPDSGLLPVDIT